jgi:dTDP-4-dehydrorhamnose reductase
MLGSDLVKSFTEIGSYEIFGLGRTMTKNIISENQLQINLEDFKFQNIKTPNFDIIVHTAALTNLNLCEQNQLLAKKINIESTQEITKLAKSINAKLIYISTDSVFNGAKGNYSETDLPSPLNYYAYTKLKGEEIVMDLYGKNSLIIRTNIYGINEVPRNTLVEWAIKEWSCTNKINGFNDMYFNALYTKQLAIILKKIIEVEFYDNILNVGSNEFISKYNFLNRLRIILGYNESLLNSCKSEEFKSEVNRPLNTTLNLSKLNKIITPPGYDDGINELIKNL